MDTPFHWIEFNVFVLIAIIVDLGVFHRRPHKISLREALLWSIVWIAFAVGFGFMVLHYYGRQPALEFYTGYLIEKALSVDNLFIFLVVFRAFSVEPRYQHRVLAWGILGALVMRGVMIAAGAALIERFSWILYVFGAFIIYAGAHILFAKEAESHPEKNVIVRYASHHLPMTRGYREEKFFIRENGRLLATPLFLVLLIVEITDVTFALDSIPAIFGITRDPFIVYTSNVFAILGLRALYFLLAGVLGKFRFLTAGLSGVLIFIGGKMLAEHWTDIPIYVSLAVVAAILGSALVLSLAFPVKKRADSGHGEKAKSAAGPREEQQAGSSIASAIECLASGDASVRERGATEIFLAARRQVEEATRQWWQDAELSGLLFAPEPRITAGIAVGPERFAAVRAANATPRLSEVPPDQDAREFELHFPGGVSLDVLTTREPGGNGAIARYLAKFGEGIQQVEFHCAGVDRATQILRERFHCNPVYAQARAGADGTRINFFLVPAAGGAKVLIELYEVAA